MPKSEPAPMSPMKAPVMTLHFKRWPVARSRFVATAPVAIDTRCQIEIDRSASPERSSRDFSIPFVLASSALMRSS